MKSWQLKIIFEKCFGKKTKQKITTYFRGRYSERIATNFLKRNGYKIIKRNFKSKLGEIDIIAKQGNYLVACEVKYRNNEDILLYSISVKQQRRIKNALLIFLAIHKEYNSCNIRFDAMFINNNNDVNHITNAWDS